MADDEKIENEKKSILSHDIETLTRTKLGNKYRAAYTSWRNGKSRAKATGHWSGQFDDFGDFLRLMGAPSTPGMTLDRIDNNNPNYGPGLCRWATKGEQANNRSTTLIDQQSGQPLSILAWERGEQPATVRQRIRRMPFPSAQPSCQPTFGRDPRQYRPWPLPDDLKVQEFWEGQWLKVRSADKIDRFKFLINSLKTLLAKLKQEISAMREPEDGAEHEREYWAVAERYDRARSVLEEAQTLYPQWMDAVRRYEGRQNEMKALRGTNYLGRNDDE